MSELSPPLGPYVHALVRDVAAIPGVAAVALGGSRARGRARADSDVDLGVYYAEGAPFDVGAIRTVAARWNDAPDPVVSDFREWGRRVDGGAWLTLRGQRVDLLYRSFEDLDRALRDASAGRVDVDWPQQPPFGYASVTCLGELAVCQPLSDPQGELARRRAQVARYPDALRAALVSGSLWGVEFGLGFARKFAARGDVLHTSACLARFAHQLVHALFAWERRWYVNDKTALEEVAELESTPPRFAGIVSGLLARPGDRAGELRASVDAMESLFREVAAACAELYVPKYRSGVP